MNTWLWLILFLNVQKCFLFRIGPLIFNFNFKKNLKNFQNLRCLNWIRLSYILDNVIRLSIQLNTTDIYIYYIGEIVSDQYIYIYSVIYIYTLKFCQTYIEDNPMIRVETLEPSIKIKILEKIKYLFNQSSYI